ncbi:hypothetical protein M0805_003075 [Coniferiporia weirii]|nr:hypothetical protein M0805_003075 [Coniferiporia weirii]
MDDPVPSSPTSSGSDNSDAFNSSSAKIYFGPLRSPEKKFAPMPSPAPFLASGTLGPSTPRRSPRLSLLPLPSCEEEKPSDHNEDGGRDEDSLSDKQAATPGTWQSVPIHDLFRNDEPSSAIASRIMRAHDNPSPPPKSLRSSLTPRRTSKLVNELSSLDRPCSKEITNSAVDPPLDSSTDRATPFTSSPLPPSELLEASPLASSAEVGNPAPIVHHSLPEVPQPGVEPDLISFDRPVLILSSDEHVDIHAPSPRHGQKPQQTVDDLLFSSPVHPILPTVGHHMNSASPANLSPAPGPSTPRRRSLRLNALTSNQVEGRLLTPEVMYTAQSPYTDAAQGRKRNRDGTEKSTPHLLLTPSKVDRPFDSDALESESDKMYSPSRKSKRDGKRAKKGDEVANDMLNLQLAESIPPGSERMQLTPSTADQDAPTPCSGAQMDAPRMPFSADLVTVSNAADQGPDPSCLDSPQSSAHSTAQRPPPGLIAPQTLVQSSTLPGGMSLLTSNSPVKLISASATDPNRTPARRVPFFTSRDPSRANTDSFIQSDGLRIFSAVNRTPVFSRPPTDSRDRSPARRVLVSEIVDKKAINCLNASAISHCPESTGTEPGSAVVKGRPDTSDSSSNKTITRATLIRPPSKKTFLAPPLSGSSSRITAPARTTKSTSSQGGSRIPRIGSLSKPTSSKLPAISARSSSGSDVPPTRLPSPMKRPPGGPSRTYNGSSSGSEDSGGGVVSTNIGPGSVRRTPAARKVNRKRENEKPTPVRPMVQMRQFIPGMYGGPVKNILSQVAEEQYDQRDVSSPSVAGTQQRGPIIVREVVKGTLQDFELRASSSKSLEALSEAKAKEHAELVNATGRRYVIRSAGPSLDAFTFECPVPGRTEEQMDVDSESLGDPARPSDKATGEAASHHDLDLSTASNARRSTRGRRASQQADVFGDIIATDPATWNGPHRKPPDGPRKSAAPPNLIFHTNGLALKTLTNNNTTKNQHYYAQLEMNVIRKAGNRPESPTMKLRTILEKQKEEQDKMRAERARRRRGDDAGDLSTDVEMQDLVVIQSAKHRRGPGEEEDYVTPVRPVNSRKGVKWDKGLETSVFIDEIEVQPNRGPRNDSVLAPSKGCLSTMPNRAPLDSLGNATNADVPLELAPEKVVVTKYVYDNDEEAQVILPKVTRSRTKKSR